MIKVSQTYGCRSFVGGKEQFPGLRQNFDRLCCKGPDSSIAVVQHAPVSIWAEEKRRSWLGQSWQVFFILSQHQAAFIESAPWYSIE